MSPIVAGGFGVSGGTGVATSLMLQARVGARIRLAPRTSLQSDVSGSWHFGTGDCVALGPCPDGIDAVGISGAVQWSPAVTSTSRGIGLLAGVGAFRVNFNPDRNRTDWQRLTTGALLGGASVDLRRGATLAAALDVRAIVLPSVSGRHMWIVPLTIELRRR